MGDALWATWHNFGPDTKAAVIGAGATLLAALFGFGALVVQMRAQARESRHAIAENERRKLKAAMYEDAVKVANELSDAITELSTMTRTMAVQIVAAAEAQAVGLGYPLPTVRYMALLGLYELFSQAMLKLTFLVERRRIIDPRLLIFRTAMSSVLFDTRDLVQDAFRDEIMPALPADAPDGTIFRYTPPTPEGAAVIAKLCERLTDALDDATAYSEDFLIELQNLLLGDLFGNRALHRVPADPVHRVVTLAEADALDAHFRANTAWGRDMARIEADVVLR